MHLPCTDSRLKDIIIYLVISCLIRNPFPLFFSSMVVSCIFWLFLIDIRSEIYVKRKRRPWCRAATNFHFMYNITFIWNKKNEELLQEIYFDLIYFIGTSNYCLLASCVWYWWYVVVLIQPFHERKRIDLKTKVLRYCSNSLGMVLTKNN